MEERVHELEGLEAQMEKVWEETRLLYEEELEILLLQRELDQAERWLSSYENTLTVEDYGVGFFFFNLRFFIFYMLIIISTWCNI